MKQQYLWVIEANKSKGMSEADAVAAADKWALDTIMARKKREATIKKYAPPLVSPNQMVRAAQKSMGTIPGGLLSEEGPGQMAPPSLLEGAYVNKIPSQQDMWREQAKIKDLYSQAPPEGVGGGYKSTLSDLQGYSILPPPQYAGSPGSPHSIDLETVSGESIPGPEVTPLQQRRMNAQMVPGFYEAFGGGHPDEVSLAKAPKHYGYDQFAPPRDVSLLTDDAGPTPQQVGWGGDMSPAEKNQYIQALGFLQQQLAKDRQKQPVQWMQMVPPRRRR